MINVLMIYYVFVMVFVGIGGTLKIIADTDIVPDNGKVNLLKFIFMYQYIVYELAEDSISIAGIILLEILTTFSVWFLNITLLIVFCLVHVGFFICKAFYFVFRKRR